MLLSGGPDAAPSVLGVRADQRSARLELFAVEAVCGSGQAETIA
jgi:hypothetical protein